MKINTIRLRCLIGWLGMLLPFLVVGVRAINQLGSLIPASISITWYDLPTSTVFMIILGAAALLLISYRGYSRIDDITLTLSGVAALCICLFPCYNRVTTTGVFNTPVDISSTIHNLSAFVFFGLLAYNSIFLFTKSDGNKTKRKKIRNAIFITCGIGMIGSFLLLIPAIPLPYYRIWLVETISLAFFGISFLTKANCYPWLFADKTA